VRLFARTRELVNDGEPLLSLAWLAGLLEAEGTFLRPTPSEPRLPIVACQMTDRDVIERVASAFGTTVTAIPRRGRRMIYGTKAKGSRAVRLMRDLAPAMGERRGSAITAALDSYSAPTRKLNFVAAQTIRDLHARGTSISSLACTFGVSRPTIRQVLDGSIYGAPAASPWRHQPLGAAVTDLSETLLGISPCEFHWLAGWLEGEGSFSRPPPSDPRRGRIVAKTRDADVAAEVGRLLRVAPLFSHDDRERRRAWSPTWRLLKRGGDAALLMSVLHPLMGSRRRSQIESALAAVS
jgi:hypothetical protein